MAVSLRRSFGASFSPQRADLTTRERILLRKPPKARHRPRATASLRLRIRAIIELVPENLSYAFHYAAHLRKNVKTKRKPQKIRLHCCGWGVSLSVCPAHSPAGRS